MPGLATQEPPEPMLTPRAAAGYRLRCRGGAPTWGRTAAAGTSPVISVPDSIGASPLLLGARSSRALGASRLDSGLGPQPSRTRTGCRLPPAARPGQQKELGIYCQGDGANPLACSSVCAARLTTAGHPGPGVRNMSKSQDSKKSRRRAEQEHQREEGREESQASVEGVSG